MTPLEELKARANPERAAQMAAYHKATRPVLGLPNAEVHELARTWRTSRSLAARVDLAASLWDSDIFEARLAAASLLTQARMKEGEPLAWAELARWVPGFDSWALADHACSAIGRRLVAQPARLDEVESWTRHENMWVRRAALVATLPWTKQNHPSDADRAIRARVLGWAAGYVPDRDWFIQKAIAWWLRELSKHDAAPVRAFLATHGAAMKAFARKDAARHLA
ncbi:DNA alkylation repair protein [Abyssibius alkaniclasticus]|uniref:DNA alkylation repair protein n=1 Tax=Abyssibius alkaniclasticus TaxID=2881234 RepID=UPI00236466DF|nr:DNA alkylation repair protein [Abyssibius alkaniclasticus]UPH70980.1 DNA alkylation repair protein [Abyssibius alkaniclasticus]|tara:strand:+ start:40 stop:711 length:672 start_codon:yes stop_codon:yes gene_type:complete